MYGSHEVTPLFEFLTNQKYNNLHTRKNKQVNKKKVLKHLHGIKLIDNNTITGYFCGFLINSKLAEFEYEIERTGTVLVKYKKGITKPQALEYLDKERKNVMEKIILSPINGYPKYLKNNFYLRRYNKSILKPAANKAVSDGVLSTRFVETMAQWNLSIIEGRK